MEVWPVALQPTQEPGIVVGNLRARPRIGEAVVIVHGFRERPLLAALAVLAFTHFCQESLRLLGRVAPARGSCIHYDLVALAANQIDAAHQVGEPQLAGRRNAWRTAGVWGCATAGRLTPAASTAVSNRF